MVPQLLIFLPVKSSSHDHDLTFAAYKRLPSHSFSFPIFARLVIVKVCNIRYTVLMCTISDCSGFLLLIFHCFWWLRIIIGAYSVHVNYIHFHSWAFTWCRISINLASGLLLQSRENVPRHLPLQGFFLLLLSFSHLSQHNVYFFKTWHHVLYKHIHDIEHHLTLC